MPWSKDKTVPALEGKSNADKELFAKVANAQLDKGRSENDAITLIGQLLILGDISGTEFGDDSVISSGFISTNGLLDAFDDFDTFEATSLFPVSRSIKLRKVKTIPSNQVIVLPKESRYVKLFAL